jgi:very-short-patch-repair endonuclease
VGAKILDSRSAAAWDIARRQHWVITRAQLLSLGFSSKAIRHRVMRGRLHAVGSGLYAVGRPQLTREGQWMAAVLACGEGAVLSHRSAAALWGFGTERRGVIDVSVGRHCSLRRPGIRVHSRPSLAAGEIGSHLNIPLTQPVRTLIDVAIELPRNRLERAVNEADKRDLIDPESLRAALDDHTGEPGVRPLRELLDRHAFRLSDSDLEVRFRAIAREAGLPTPLTKQWVNAFEVDFFWPDLGLVVETDGLRYHRTASAQSRDVLRGQTHTAAGLTALRFSHYQVRYAPNHVVRILQKTTANLHPRS